jgi:hypothetical protein
MRKTRSGESVGREPTARSKGLPENEAHSCSVGCHAGGMAIPVDPQGRIQMLLRVEGEQGV